MESSAGWTILLAKLSNMFLGLEVALRWTWSANAPWEDFLYPDAMKPETSQNYYAIQVTPLECSSPHQVPKASAEDCSPSPGADVADTEWPPPFHSYVHTLQ